MQPKHEQERRDRFAHVIVDRRAAAIDVFPPRDQVVGPVAGDLLVVDLGQVDLDGLGDELRHRSSCPAQLVVVVHRRRGRVGAELARERAASRASSTARRSLPRNAGEPLVALGKLLRVGVFALVAEQVSARQAAAVGAVYGIAVAIASLERIHQPTPADLVLEPVDVPSLNDELAVQSAVSRREPRSRRCAPAVTASPS